MPTLKSICVDEPLPPFEVGVALHQGPCGMTRLEGLLGGAAQFIPVGETVAQARTIRRLAPRVAGAITVSESVMRALAGSGEDSGAIRHSLGC